MKPDDLNGSAAFRARNPQLFGRIAPTAPRTAQREVGHGGIQDEIEAWLKSLGHACYWVRSRTDAPTTNAVGTPDFIGWWCGKPFALEVKRPGKKETREQAGELLRCRLAGGVAAIVHSVAEARATLGFDGTCPEHID